MKRVVFFGSPSWALPALEVLLDGPDLRVCGAITAADRPAGRGRQLRPCAVKAAAEARGLPCFAPQKLEEAALLHTLRIWGAEIGFLCAYGQILSPKGIDAMTLGVYNLHFSLLPRWRGASPIQAALLAGDAYSGVSIQRIVPALDAGPIVAESEAEWIRPQDTAATLGERLAQRGGELLHAQLPQILSGRAPLHVQDESHVRFCRRLRKSAGLIDCTRVSAEEIERRCRAYDPWPGCWAFLNGQRLGILRVAVVPPQAAETAAVRPMGMLDAQGIARSAQGAIRLLRVRPANRAAMPWEDFLRGAPQAVGAILRSSP